MRGTLGVAKYLPEIWSKLDEYIAWNECGLFAKQALKVTLLKFLKVYTFNSGGTL
jgi:hypothetical protein